MTRPCSINGAHRHLRLRIYLPFSQTRPNLLKIIKYSLEFMPKHLLEREASLMKVTVIFGSPHMNGASALLAEKFIAGAQEAGNDVFRFDAAFEDIKPCKACNYCANHDGACVHKDSMIALTEKLLVSDIVVFVTPLYYYTFSAQIKAVIDRFHANNKKLKGNKQAILMATSHGADDWTMRGLENTYEATLRFLAWKDAGKLLATGCPSRVIIGQTEYPDRAFEIGKNIK